MYYDINWGLCFPRQVLLIWWTNHNEFENNFWHQYGSQYNARTRMRLTDVEIKSLGKTNYANFNKILCKLKKGGSVLHLGGSAVAHC